MFAGCLRTFGIFIGVEGVDAEEEVPVGITEISIFRPEFGEVVGGVCSEFVVALVPADKGGVAPSSGVVVSTTIVLSFPNFPE